MNHLIRKSALSHQRRRLVELMESEPFCNISRLHIRGGEPVLQPPPTVITFRKLGTEPCEMVDRDVDYLLKCEIIDLSGTMAEIGDGVIEELEVRFGLPCTVKFVQPCAMAGRSAAH